MKIGIFIICLVILAFATALYKLFKSTPDWKKDEREALGLTLATLIALFMLVATVMLTVMVVDIAMLQQTNPEIEVSSMVDSTTAPDDSSVPKPEETIHNDIPAEPSSEPVTPPTEPETTPAIDPDELEMLACVIYQEAGGNACCDDCRRRVADIVLNRVADKRFPNTIYGVLTARGQYGRFHWTGIVWPERHTNPGEKKAVERAYRIAREVLSGQHSEVYGKGYIWQAEFKQGKEGFWCCGHYFGKS